MPSLAPGRQSRRSSVDTKARILDAAQAIFAERGYAQSVLTEIAESADVTAPLIIRYFGSKEGLFEEAFAQCLATMPALASEPLEFGRMAIGLMSGGHLPTMRASAMLAHSIGDPRAREIARRLVKQHVLAPLGKRVDDPEGAARAELILMLGVGYATMRMVVPAETDAGGESSFLTDWLADALQSIIDRPRKLRAAKVDPVSRQAA
jgi:AcrR family transcriptional regulator